MDAIWRSYLCPAVIDSVALRRALRKYGRLVGTLLGAGAALHALGGRAVDVIFGDPGLIKAATGAGVANKGLTLDGHILLDRGGARLLGLGEERLEVGLVDKVRDAAENGSQDEVEEDAAGTTHVC